MSAHCTSCGAEIEWALTVKGSRIPLDVDRNERGNIDLDADGVAHYVPTGHGNRVSHFATCPNASAHRRRTTTGR